MGDRLAMREGVAEGFDIVDVRAIDEAAAKQLLEQKASGTLPLVVAPATVEKPGEASAGS